MPHADTAGPPVPGTGIGRRLGSVARNQTAIVVGSVIALNLLRVVSTILLTRVLAPEVYGVVGIIVSIAFILEMLTDLGFQAFVIRHREGDDPRFLDAIWTIRLIRSLMLTVALVLLAQPIANALDKPELGGMIALSASFFLIDGLSSLTLLTALRRGLLLRLSLMELGVAVAQLIVAVLLAMAWRNAWAMVVATLVGTSLKSICSYIVFPDSRRRFRFDSAYASELWRFARFVTGSSIISMVLIQADKIVLARVLPLDVLGLYVLAGNLALAPLAFTNAYATRVLYPMFARTAREQPERLPQMFYAARRGGSMLYMFGAGGLIGVAPLLIAMLYDDRYSGAATFLRLLAITPLFALASAATNEVLTASGRVQSTLQLSFVKLAWLTVAGVAGFVWFGPIGLIAAVGTVEAAAAIYGWMLLSRIGILNPMEEAALMAAGAGGIGVGLIVNAAAGAWFGFAAA